MNDQLLFLETILSRIAFADSQSTFSWSVSGVNCGIGIGRIIESIATMKKYPSQISVLVQSDLFIAHAVTFAQAVLFDVKTIFAVTSIKSPWRAGALNSSVSIEIVTNSLCANFAQTIPAALSIRDNKRPPKSVLYAFVS